MGHWGGGVFDPGESELGQHGADQPGRGCPEIRVVRGMQAVDGPVTRNRQLVWNGGCFHHDHPAAQIARTLQRRQHVAHMIKNAEHQHDIIGSMRAGGELRNVDSELFYI